MDSHRIAGDGIAATIKADGAELCSLRDASGAEFLWQALPVWPRHAPVLFPIVGRLARDTLRHRGRSYPLTQHGFARDRRFAWEERTPTSCRLSLRDDSETRARYPFAFCFEVSYAVTRDTLSATYAIVNPGEATLLASMGAHPAFRWPLADGVPKQAHTLTFAAAEPAPVRRLRDGLLLPELAPTPVIGTTLHLHESLFAADALIFDQPTSPSIRFTAPHAPWVEMSWDGFHQLGLWSKPSADFLCIEPWCGYASPAGFDGEFVEKPGLLLIQPGQRREATHRVRLGA